MFQSTMATRHLVLLTSISIAVTAYLVSSGLYAVLAAIIGAVLFDYIRGKDSSFSHRVAIKQYLRHRFVLLYGLFLYPRFIRASKNIQQTQHEALMFILNLNRDTEYSRKFELDTVKSREELRKIHPLAKFSQFEPYINRTANGERKVIVSQDPFYYGTTSGTTGKPSLVPIVPALKWLYLEYGGIFLQSIYGKIPELSNPTRSMKLYYNPRNNLPKTPSGVKMGPISACPEVFRFGPTYTSPPIVYELANEDVCRYVHLLFGLRYKNLRWVETIFVPIIYYAFEELEKNWKYFVEDIRIGGIRKDLDIPLEVRREVERMLMPDPERAHELEMEFRIGFQGIARRIWPKLGLITCASGGPFKNYTRLVREKYVGDEVLIFDAHVGSTENILGMNIWPLERPPRYLLWPWKSFMEFIRADDIPEEQPETLFMDQLEKGQDYEVVVTTVGGLTRYRLGDVLRVVGFYNQIPVVEFQYRSGHLLNIRGEKVPEVLFGQAILEAVKGHPDVEEMIDHTICTNISLPGAGEEVGTAPFYVFFVELRIKNDTVISKLENELSKKVDEWVLANHHYYKFYRNKHALDQAKVALVKDGTFGNLRQFMLDTSTTSPTQLKLPKVLVKDHLIEFINKQRVSH